MGSSITTHAPVFQARELTKLQSKKKTQQIDAEFHAPFTYEYARECPSVIKKIAQWRKNETSLSAIAMVAAGYKATDADKISSAEYHLSYSTPFDDEAAFPPLFLASFEEFPARSWSQITNADLKKYWVDNWHQQIQLQYTDVSHYFVGGEEWWMPVCLPRLGYVAKRGHTVLALAFDRSRFQTSELRRIFDECLAKNSPKGSPIKIDSKRRHYTGRALPFEPRRALRWLETLREWERFDEKNHERVKQSEFQFKHSYDQDEHRILLTEARKRVPLLLAWFSKGGLPPVFK